MTDPDQGPEEPKSPFGLPQRPFHVQAFELQGVDTLHGEAPGHPGSPSTRPGSRMPLPGSYLPQPGSNPQHSPAARPPDAMAPDAMRPVKSPVSALVCGILAWFTFGLTAIPAIILGVKGRRAAREGRTESGGMATTGLWLGSVNVVVGLLMIPLVFAVVIPVFLNQRQKGIDVTLAGDMNKMAALQYGYMKANPGRKGFHVPATSPGGMVKVPGVAFAASPGNVIAVKVGPKGFCVSGYNAAASHATSPTASKVFPSDLKGIEAGVGTC